MWSPFQKIRIGENEHLEVLINPENVNTLNVDGQSLLHEAVAYKNLEAVRILIRKNIDVNISDPNGQTPLHYLPLYKNIDIAKVILENGGDVNKTDIYGNSPLWTATFNARGEYDLVKLYKEYHAKSDIRNKAGKTPVDFALQIKDEQLVSILQ